ncbi:PKD domain-containing protein [Fontimonas sp. SYSU GA230001]|uniref:PKD domain-containing protein n=1 Tax=Fontimonas sp. SYSU GA230001 TaxID=3142450 RepID=UPI0032B4DB3E
MLSNQRWVRAAALGVLFCGGVHAADPASGTLTPDSPELSYTSGPFIVSNPSGTATGEPACAAPVQPCDDYSLTVTLPAGFVAAHPNAEVKVTVAWDMPADDIDAYMYADGVEVGHSASSANPEVMVIPAADGTHTYTIRLVPYLVTGSTATTTVQLVTPSSGGGSTPTPTPPPASGLPPRYQVLVSPPELGNDSGEPTLGFNPFTQRVMFIDYVNALRVTMPEDRTPALPVACDALWEDKSGTITQLNTLDPILTTDQATGRTFNSQLSGANSLFEYSDDDGETWTPGQIGIPNGGADHQGVVAGPYPAGFPTAGLLYPNAVYYCSQSVGAAFCSRSDDGGQTFGPGMPFKNLDCAAGALHGHPKVAPDGTLYIPDSSQCVLGNGLDGSSEHVVAFVSEDAGMTYEVRPIPQSAGGAGSDPSIGIATDGTVYMCYENADGTTHVAVSHDKGQTWINDTDVGAAAGLVATRFQAMVAGDPDRAACAFLGTSTKGPSESLDFKGVWYPYIATTYDGGATWHLVNVAPNDPVQGYGGVGPSGTNRNLLDFNDAEIDDEGRVLFAYADGCIDACVIDPAANSFAAKGTIVRQTGGRTLYAAFDEQMRFNAANPMAPDAACAVAARSKRTQLQTRVAWNAPDSGGSDITRYDVYRAPAASGPFTLVGNTDGKTDFVDGTADPAVEKYYYKVVAQNARGTAPESNVIELPLTQEAVVDTCSLPGEIVASDALGDGLGDDFDFEYLAVAEPQAFDGNLVITMKLAGFTATTPPPGSFYTVLFPLNGARYIALNSADGPTAFEYGTYSELPQGLLAFTPEGSLDERSSYAADGTVVMVVPKSLFGDLAPGTIISGFDARARAGSSSAPSRDTAGPGSYVIRGSAGCGAVGTLLANIQASTQRGAAPLTVRFTISGQSADGKALQSWSVDFGDGEKLEDQPFGAGQTSAQVSHTYREAGVYAARAKVKDVDGRVNSNTPEQFITVTAPGTGGGTQDAGRFGGALGLGLLLPLAGLALSRRRRMK